MAAFHLTKSYLPALGVDPAKVLSPGFQLADFSLRLAVQDAAAPTTDGSSVEVVVTGPGTDERNEIEVDKILKAVSEALKAVDERLDLRAIFGNGEYSLNERKIEFPDDWLE